MDRGARGLALNWLARVVAERDRLDEAESLCQRELEHHLSADEPDPERIDATLATLDGMNSALGRHDAARYFAARGSSRWSGTRGPTTPT